MDEESDGSWDSCLALEGAVLKLELEGRRVWLVAFSVAGQRSWCWEADLERAGSVQGARTCERHPVQERHASSMAAKSRELRKGRLIPNSGG